MPAQSTTLSFYTDIYTTGTTAVLTTTSVLSMPAYYHNQSTFNPPYNVLTFPSNPEKGCGYYGISSGLHTVTYKTTQDYVGTVTMQATLASNPIETDWFAVKDTAKTYLYNQNPQTTSTFENFTRTALSQLISNSDIAKFGKCYIPLQNVFYGYKR